MRRAFIIIAIVLSLGFSGLVIYETIEGRYLNAIAWFSVASVFLWFATHRRDEPEE